jgi:hypothetical protein
MDDFPMLLLIHHSHVTLSNEALVLSAAAVAMVMV